MPITFTCKEHASVVMLEKDALMLIRMMGHSGAVPGVVKGEHTQLALTSLEKSVATQVQSTNVLADQIDENDFDQEQAIPLGNRSLPLRQMLNFALENTYDVMWE